jgi:2-keto-4-pentenoate hydratase/2-oxohepta-3-ene-1,7-dioic acid hydratase in catechol pathway
MSVRLAVTSRGIAKLEGDRAQLLDTEHADLGAALAAGESLEALAGATVTGEAGLEEIELLAPVARPPQIWAVGLNYKAHVAEIKGMDLKEPFIFPKSPTAVVGPGDPIEISAEAGDQVDFEGEMALVIGRRAENVAAADAGSYLAGITICNDVSARTLQKGYEGVRANISMAKSFRTFAPLGPAVALWSSLPDLDDLKLETKVDGEVRQSATLAQLIFGVPELVEFLTARITLLPGDIVATGTPEGVGDVDGRYLAPGSEVSIELDEVGVLANPVTKTN